jgi:uncharacterized RDD family membrane protein YckC
MEDGWYCAESNTGAVGPMSREELGAILRGKASAAGFLVWCPGMADWARAGDVQALRGFLTPPPTVARSRAPGVSSPAAAARPARSAAAPMEAISNQAEHAGGATAVATRPRPWSRFFARMADLYVFGLVFTAFIVLAFPQVFGPSYHGRERITDMLLSFLVLLAYVPFEALCMNVLGTTLGKALYGIRVTNAAGHALSLSTSFVRALSIWAGGLGAGIPLVGLFTLIAAYSR